jgi:hypothetical protein
MTHLETLQTDLEIHRQSLAGLEDGTGGFFIKRAGYSVASVIHSYKRIIQSLEEEILALQSKSRRKR